MHDDSFLARYVLTVALVDVISSNIGQGKHNHVGTKNGRWWVFLRPSRVHLNYIDNGHENCHAVSDRGWF